MINKNYYRNIQLVNTFESEGHQILTISKDMYYIHRPNKNIAIAYTKFRKKKTHKRTKNQTAV